MRKRNGFTLVELLAIIVIIGTVMLIVIPSVATLIKDSSKKIYAADEKMLANAAEGYYAAHDTELPTFTSGAVNMNISTLVSGGYMRDIKNNSDGSTCTGYVYVQRNSNRDSYTYTPYIQCGTDYSTSGYGTSGTYYSTGLVAQLDGYSAPTYSGSYYYWGDISGANACSGTACRAQMFNMSAPNPTIVNGVVTSGYDATNHVYVFDGIDDYMTIPRMMGTGSFTIEVTYSTTQGAGLSTSTAWYNGAGLVDSEVNGVGKTDFGIAINGNGYVLGGTGRGDNVNDMLASSNVAFNNDIVHTVVLQRSNANPTLLYVDYSYSYNSGFSFMNDTTTYPFLTTPDINIGKSQVATPPDRTFKGKIYAVRIYNNSTMSPYYNSYLDRGRFGK